LEEGSAGVSAYTVPKRDGAMASAPSFTVAAATD